MSHSIGVVGCENGSSCLYIGGLFKARHASISHRQRLESQSRPKDYLSGFKDGAMLREVSEALFDVLLTFRLTNLIWRTDEP